MIEQSDWQDVIDQSGYTLTAVLREFNLNYSSLSNWLKCKVTPTDKNKAKMEAVLSKLVSGGGVSPFIRRMDMQQKLRLKSCNQ